MKHICINFNKNCFSLVDDITINVIMNINTNISIWDIFLSRVYWGELERIKRKIKQETTI